MNPFRTIEISEERLELGGLRFVTVKSRAMRGRADITLYAPPGAAAAKDLPLVILLHGVYGSHWAWAFKGGAHRTVQRMIASGETNPIALAMPSDGLWGDGSGYLRHADGADFERWIVEEVPAAAVAALPCVSSSSPLCIAGLSMGGFGALRLGAKYPGRFQAIAGHSSITNASQMKMFVEENAELFGIAPDDESVLGAFLKNRDTLPPVRFDCGVEDPLIGHNRTLHRELERHGIAHQYEEHAGGHEWAYWEKHLADTLKFFNQTLAGIR